MKGKISQNKAIKRQKILSAAKEIFFTNGFFGANMDQIAALAGVTKQTVYRYFSNKEALFLAMLEKQMLQTTDHFLEALKIDDPSIALKLFAEGFIHKHLSEDHLAMIRLLVAEGELIPEITTAFFASGPQKVRNELSLFLQVRFDIDQADDEVNAFLNILLSPRMPVLMGLKTSLTDDEIDIFATKSVAQFLKLLGIEPR